MKLNEEEIVALLEPLTHKRIGKIEYTPENFEKYWTTLARFGFISDDAIGTDLGELCHFYAKTLHGQARKWYLSRGKIQSISYKCNRVEENARRIMKRFRDETELQWVWQVKGGSRWGPTIGYVVSTQHEGAAQSVANMMYHTADEVDVIRIKPLFNLGNFLERQQHAKRKIQSKIAKFEEAIKDSKKEIELLENQLRDLVTNSVCFSGEE